MEKPSAQSLANQLDALIGDIEDGSFMEYCSGDSSELDKAATLIIDSLYVNPNPELIDLGGRKDG